MPQRLKVETRTNFAGGVDAKSSPWAASPKAVLRAENIIFDEIGSLRTRSGYSVYDTRAGATLTTIKAIGGLVINLLGSGFFGLAIVVDTADGLQKLVHINTGPAWVVRGTFANVFALPAIVPFSSRVIMPDGYAVPKYYDGTTFGPLTAGAGQTVPAGALYMINHLNQLWVWNTSLANTALDGPSSLRACDVANPHSWPNSFQTFIAKDDGDKGCGLASFSIGEVGIAPFPILVAFKNFSAYQITSTFGGSDFSIQQIKTNMGCIASRSIQFLPGLGIVRLTHQGFAVYNGLTDTVLSTPVDPYIFGSGDVAGIDLDMLPSSAIATTLPSPLTYLCACPLASSGVVRRWFAFDVLQQTWTIFDVPGPGATGLTAMNLVHGYSDPIIPGFPAIYLAFAGSKTLYVLDTTATTDAGTAIAARVRVRPVTTGSPLHRGYHRRMLAKVYNVTAGQSVTGTFALGPAQQPGYGVATPQSVATVQTLVAASAAPGAPLAGQLEEDLLWDIGRSGEVQWVELAWQGPLTLRATEWHSMPKAFGRPMHV